MTKTKRRRVPSYRLHKPTGQAVVTLNSRDIYLGLHDNSRSRERYDRMIAPWLANGRKVPSDARDELTVIEVVARYWRSQGGYYSRGHNLKVKSVLRVLKSLYASTKASCFGPIALKTV